MLTDDNSKEGESIVAHARSERLRKKGRRPMRCDLLKYIVFIGKVDFGRSYQHVPVLWN
jgi:hypothetical protein